MSKTHKYRLYFPTQSKSVLFYHIHYQEQVKDTSHQVALRPITMNFSTAILMLGVATSTYAAPAPSPDAIPADPPTKVMAEPRQATSSGAFCFPGDYTCIGNSIVSLLPPSFYRTWANLEKQYTCTATHQWTLISNCGGSELTCRFINGTPFCTCEIA
jgi:hypothetical protein